MILNKEVIADFKPNAFVEAKPFPFFNFKNFLSEEAFRKLLSDFPSWEFFEKHTGISRPGGQRPHDRYYLAYEESVYEGIAREEKGVVKDEDLPESWRTFIAKLKTDRDYHAFIKRLLGVQEFTMRFAWHIGVTGSEVSPHRDAVEKIGTHIFYFNTSEDWDPKWGGSILALGGKTKSGLNPDFSDFVSSEAAEILNNRSFLFKNTPEAWHGVHKLTCPADRGRRLFNVIFEVPSARKPHSLLYRALRFVKRRVFKVFGGVAIVGHLARYLVFRDGRSLAKALPFISRLAATPISVRVRDVSVKLGVSSDVELFRLETYSSKEPETLDWIDKNFSPTDVFYDVGANIGLYSLYAAKKIGCRVLSFEPEAQNFSRLMFNVFHNDLRGKVVPYSVALADRNGLETLHVTTIAAGHSQHNLGAPNVEYMGADYVAPILQGVMGLTIDHLWRNGGLPVPNHLKIDVDGLEEKIIAGCVETFRNPAFKTLLIEVNTETGVKNGILETLGRSGLRLQGVFRRPSSTDQLDISNYIFVRQ